MKKTLLLVVLALVLLFAFSTSALAGEATFSATPDLDFPTDAGNTIQSTIEVTSSDIPEGNVITKVTVTINITHTFTGDLHVYLISPAGKRIALTISNGGAGDNFTNTVFDDDDNNTSITSILPIDNPFTGTYKPQELLSGLNGENPLGNWILEVTDNIGGDDGTLDSWSITITYDAPTYQKGELLVFGEKPAIPEPEVETIPAYINGYSDGTFRANNSITRAETAKIFSIAAGPIPATLQMPVFSDVKEGDWFAPYVVTAVTTRLAEGYPDGSFRPAGEISTAEFIAMACRMMGLEESTEAAPYTDIADHWAAGYINAAYAAGWLSELTNDELMPDRAITRGQAVIILNLALGRYDLEIHEAGPDFSDIEEISPLYNPVKYASSVMVAPETK